MNNGDMPINAVADKNGNIERIGGLSCLGLTKREYFAGMAMQGFCTDTSIASNQIMKDMVEASIACADELLKQLESNNE